MVGIDDYLLDFDPSLEEGGENIFGGNEGRGGVEEIWVDNHRPLEDDDLLFMDFPPLISDHFSCMSSSSSTSSTPAPTRPIVSSSSSSSAASWALFKPEVEEDRFDRNRLHAGYDQNQIRDQHFGGGGGAPVAAGTLSTTPVSMEFLATEENRGIYNIDCMNNYVMENFGFMDLMDNTHEIWDPSSILRELEKSGGEDEAICSDKIEIPPIQIPPTNDDVTEEDIGEVFFEWLKANKEHISVEDMRKIKLRKATVECASNRLGTSKEGKKQLLKLILEWVGQYQLKKRNMPEESHMTAAATSVAAAAAAAASASAQMTCQTHQVDHFPHPPNPNIVPEVVVPRFSPSPWLPPQQPYGGAYIADPYANILNHPTVTNHQYHPTWQPAQFIPGSSGSFAAGMGGYRGINQPQYSYLHYYRGVNGERLARQGSSATKEARQKRMARQKRIFSHHHNRHDNHHRQHMPQNQNHAEQRVIPSDNFTTESQMNAAPANWAHWTPSSSATPNGSGIPAPLPSMAAAEQKAQPQFKPMEVVDTEEVLMIGQQQKKQGSKGENNMKFLFQKVLKQSDVGNLGRIVLPKKEAEAHLPVLEARDGITIFMEDIGISRIWKMRYRFWPNNKSRMYILENTGEFVRTNGLQEGDFVVIYSDVKCGTYMIRGVKVKQSEPKPEPKKLVPKSYNYRPVSSYMGSSSSWQP